ncbi:uncharacterized protein [Gorilla gorilla gorilla]|uniref:uncharacterized protein n=1 Tax=Gorilla gorilla gorilla TaxID=9595 RepID=UPI0030098555
MYLQREEGPPRGFGATKELREELLSEESPFFSLFKVSASLISDDLVTTTWLLAELRKKSYNIVMTITIIIIAIITFITITIISPAASPLEPGASQGLQKDLLSSFKIKLSQPSLGLQSRRRPQAAFVLSTGLVCERLSPSPKVELTATACALSSARQASTPWLGAACSAPWAFTVPAAVASTLGPDEGVHPSAHDPTAPTPPPGPPRCWNGVMALWLGPNSTCSRLPELTDSEDCQQCPPEQEPGPQCSSCIFCSLHYFTGRSPSCQPCPSGSGTNEMR